MNSLVLIKKEIRENRVTILVGLILLIGTAFLNAFLFDVMNKLLDSSKSNVPGIFQESLQMMRSFDSYIWFGWFGKNYSQFMTVLAVITGMGLIAGEVSRDTISFILTKPYSRLKVYLIKYATASVMLLALGLVATLVQYLAILVAGKEYSLSKLLLGVVGTFPGLLVIFSLTVLFSVIFSDRLKAGLFTAAVAIALAIPGLFPDYAKYSIYKAMNGTEILKGAAFPWVSFFVLIAISAVLIVAGALIFRRRQY